MLKVDDGTAGVGGGTSVVVGGTSVVGGGTSVVGGGTSVVGDGTSVVGGGTSVVGGGISVVGGGISVVGGGTGARVLVGLGVRVGLGVFVIVGGGTGEFVKVGGGTGELVCVGTTVGISSGFELEFPARRGRCVLVCGTNVADAVTVGVMDATTVGERLLDVGVLEGTNVGVIKFGGNASIVSTAAVLTLSIAIWMMLLGCKDADVFGFASAIPAVTHSRLKPSMPAPTTHRRST